MTPAAHRIAAAIREGRYAGLDLRALVRRFVRLDAMRWSKRESPSVVFRTRRSGVSGVAYGSSASLRVAVGADPNEVVEVLLHEVVHLSCPNRHHDELFRRRLIGCAREVFGLDIDVQALLALPPTTTQPVRNDDETLLWRGRQRKRAYVIDDAITAAMRAVGVAARLAEDPSLAAADEYETESPEERVARVADARAERARKAREHAAEKLAEWECKLAAVRRHASRWRTKVRRYERIDQAARTAEKGGA